MKSKKDVIPLEQIVLPYPITFPVTVELSINRDFFLFPKDKEVFLDASQYQALQHSSFAKYLKEFDF